MLKKISSRFLLLNLAIIAAIIVSIRIVLAHGSMQDPVSRIYACYLENPETPDTVVCKDVIDIGGTQPLYDWNEVHILNAFGNHQELIPDGHLCSAGQEKYAALDMPRTDWARTILPDSGMYTFLFNAYVPHNQGYFELYVTKDGFDPTQPLNWVDLELFAFVDQPPIVDGNYSMPVQLPQGKSGYHLIYAIWQRYDSGEAFYSCSDVWFGDAPTPTPTPAPACVAPAWNSGIVYAAGDSVSYNNREWTAKWSNSSTEPTSDGIANPWGIQAYCQSDGPTPTPTNTPPGPTATATTTPPGPTATATVPTPGGTCAVAYEVVNQWGTGFQADVTITNNSETAVSGWTLEWTHAVGQQVTSAWNANVTQTGNDVTASNPVGHWNGTISANGGSVSFGFQGSHTGTVIVPTDFVLNNITCNDGTPPPTATPTATTQPPTATPTTQPPTPTATTQPPTATPTATPSNNSGCAVNYDVTNTWGTGFTTNVTITNLDNTAINGWALSYEFPGNQTIVNLWNGSYAQTGQSVSVTNADWNNVIPAQGSVSFGFQGAYSGSNDSPTTFILNGTTCN